MQTPGQLFIVATPIGNLDDISFRAIQTLKDVDIIAAEDTRHTAKLLTHFNVSTKTTAFHDHNEKQKVDLLINWLKAGKNVALVSDAGTPLISDPGYTVVNHCRAEQLKVVPIPGPCAAIAALSCSGLPTDQFSFLGFVPAKTKARMDFYQETCELPGTSVVYESPRRVIDSMKDLIAVSGDARNVVLAKEITKTWERFFSGTTGELLAWLQSSEDNTKGEMVLMLAPVAKNKEEISDDAQTLLARLVDELPLKKAAAIVADIHGLKKNAVYKFGLEVDNK